jgi:ribosomal protein S18 acetylase RimI-like enzyme
VAGQCLLRTGREEDLRALAALDRTAFEDLDGDDPYSYGAFRQFLDLFPDLLVVAEQDGSLVGYALGGMGSERGWILGVAVEPSAQGAGIGRALTEALLERMRARGVGNVGVTVHPNNAPALALYRILGFEQERVEPDYFGEGKPRVVLSHAAEPVTPAG